MTEMVPLETQDDVRRGLGQRRTRRIAVLVLALVLCLALDQVTKDVARRTLALGPRSALGGLIRLEFAENRGAFMSLGSTLSDAARVVLLFLLAAIVLGILAVLAFRARSLELLQFTALSLIAAGGCSNLIDRILNHGSVVDWVSVGIGWLRTGVFNVADVAIVGGGLVFLLSSFRGSRQEQNGKP